MEAGRLLVLRRSKQLVIDNKPFLKKHTYKQNPKQTVLNADWRTLPPAMLQRWRWGQHSKNKNKNNYNDSVFFTTNSEAKGRYGKTLSK